MTFILRQVADDSEANVCLGEEYNLADRVRHSEAFNRTLEIWSGGVEHPDHANIQGFVIFDGKSRPLYSTYRYYIMVGSGQTFAKLSTW